MLRSVTLLQEARADQSKWAPRVITIKRELNRLIQEIHDLLEPYPIDESLWRYTASQALENGGQ